MQKKELHIAGRIIGLNTKPFIVAEMSGNHNQSLERALQIVAAAAKAGAHAIKLQTYTADTMTLNATTDDFLINDDKSLWKGKNLYQLYQEAHTPWDWHPAIFKRAQELGMICFSSPFDETAVDFLETLNVPCYKIASYEVTDLPLLKKVAATKKPVIVSTGMSTVQEIETAIHTLQNNGCNEIVILKCTSTYPASPENTNILTIPDMRQKFGVEVGLSDHTMGIGVAVASVALGATVIEKHFTLSRAEGGVDAAFSMEPAELAQLVQETERAWLALGKVTYGASNEEQKYLRFRRSIYVSQPIKKGEKFTKENIKIIRPGFGLSPKDYETILGKQATQDLAFGKALAWDDVLEN